MILGYDLILEVRKTHYACSLPSVESGLMPFLNCLFPDFKNDDLGDLLITKVCDNYGLIAYKEYFGLKYTVTDEKDNHEIVRTLFF